MQEQSAVKIQATFKSHKRKSEFRKQRESAVKIQSVYRGHSQRKKYLNEKQKRSATPPDFILDDDPSEQQAATKIQAVFKGHKNRSHFKEQRDSAIVIQKVFRGYRTRKYLQNGSLTLKNTKKQPANGKAQRANVVKPSKPSPKTESAHNSSFDDGNVHYKRSLIVVDESVLHKSSSMFDEGAIGDLPPQVSEAMRKMQTEIKKKNLRISELKERNKQLAAQSQAKGEVTPETVKLKDQYTDMKKKRLEDEKLLKQREEELEDIKRNYERVTKILQSKKVEVQGKNQSNSWKQELVKRNQDVQAKQQQVEELEKRMNLFKSEKEREGNLYKSKLSRVESEMNSLRQELLQLHHFIRVCSIFRTYSLTGSRNKGSNPLVRH
jgi:hypothetical protein